MAAIALRSPQYKTAVADTGTPLSAKITISIDGTIEYTLDRRPRNRAAGMAIRRDS